MVRVDAAMVRTADLLRWRVAERARLGSRQPSLSSPEHPFVAAGSALVSPCFSLYDPRIRSLAAGIKDGPIVLLAADLAVRGHGGQTRKSGEPYFIHPLTVAEIIADWGLGAEERAAALGHDLIEDARIGGRRVTREQLIACLGERPAQIIEGVTELGKEPESNGSKPLLVDIYKKWLEYGARDLAIIIVKLADRLHNMRTLAYTEPDKRRQKAEETLNIFGRIADILGMWKIKRELEDLSFKYVDEGKFRLIKAERKRVFEDSNQKIRETVFRLEKHFRKAGLAVALNMEKRSIYELSERMSRRHLGSLTPGDVWRLNIVAAGEGDCYEALRLLHQVFPPVQEEIRDHIAAPRPNGHRFLHSVVSVPGFGRLLAQIRDPQMKKEYQLGVLARLSGGELKFKEDFTWLNALKDYLQSTGVTEDQFYGLVAAVSSPIVVYTHEGYRLQLPFGSTALDFAHKTGEEVFLRAKAARINNVQAPLSRVLQEGDTVSIVTDPGEKPRLEWIRWVRTPDAQSTLRASLKQRSFKEIFDDAITFLDQETMRHYLPARQLIESDFFNQFLAARGYQSGDDFLFQAGTGQIRLEPEVSRFIDKVKLEIVLNRAAGLLARHRYLVTTGEDRPGLLGDITTPLKSLDINLAQGFFDSISGPGSRDAEIFLVVEGVSGPVAVVQQIQVRTIVSRVPGVKDVTVPSEKEAAQIIRDFGRRKRP